ncbi:hypothetical protein BJ875DRAFT_478816 [Amylocarpus encephaloides]|uniref:Uncharacterized protein n=1 Tax=Amylocarpus encephaloides TaxID=45428 RepID=A0A9P7Y6S2_9HELO|nr:hypothetical protein BJ875DRAFT_478816 [Amylocarpus encephaloides]
MQNFLCRWMLIESLLLVGGTEAASSLGPVDTAFLNARLARGDFVDWLRVDSLGTVHNSNAGLDVGAHGVRRVELTYFMKW